MDFMAGHRPQAMCQLLLWDEKVWLSHLNGKVSTILPDSGNQFLFSSKANLVNAIRNWAPWWVKWRWEHVVLITFYPDSFGTAAECIFWNFRSCFGNFRIFQKVWQKCEIWKGENTRREGENTRREGENQTKHFLMTICFVFECLWQQLIALESGKWMFAAVHLLLRTCGKMCVTGVLLLVLAFI